MALTERRKIEELTTLYRLEPALRDIFVEGSSDRHLIDWFLRENGVQAPTVTEIDAIDIPSELVIDAGLEDNNKGRLIVLAREFERRLGGAVSAACLVDADFDRFLGNEIAAPRLIVTDYTCMEMYFYDSRCINKFLGLSVRGFPKSALRVLAELANTLQELFLMRAANYVLGWSLKLTQFEKQCEITAVGIKFNRIEYIRRVLLANGRGAQRQEFFTQIEECRRRVTGSPRNQAHGHDFVNLLTWYVRAHGKPKINRELVERALPACTESAWLSDEEMFKSLLRHAIS